LGRACRSRSTTQQSPHWLQWTPQIHPQKCSFPFDDLYSHRIHPSLDRPHSLPQTASGSNQPFCHNTLSGHRHTQTDRWDRRQVYSNSAYALLIVSDALIIYTINKVIFIETKVNKKLLQFRNTFKFAEIYCTHTHST